MTNNYVILVSYQDKLYYTDSGHAIDAKIRQLAEEKGGKEVGSGIGFGHRDIEIGFTNETDADVYRQEIELIPEWDLCAERIYDDEDGEDG